MLPAIPFIAPALGFLTGGNFTRLFATVAIGVAIGGVGAWKVQAWRWESNTAARDRAAAAAVLREAERSIDNLVKKDSANEKRTKTIINNALAADRARTESERLRGASERSLSGARADHAACIVSATAHAELFNHCQRDYRGMAEKADGHATDAKALIDAWPK
jgi:hypothetical protein